MFLFKKNLGENVLNGEFYSISYLVCPDGSYNEDCRDKCPYPFYGHKCGSICDCSNETCNHVTGCNSSKTTIDGESIAICYD